MSQNPGTVGQLMQRLTAPGQVGSEAYRQALAEAKQLYLSPALCDNLQLLQAVMQDCSDVVYLCFQIGLPAARRAVLVFVDGLVDRAEVDRTILDPLITKASQIQGSAPQQGLVGWLAGRLLTQADHQLDCTIGAVVDAVIRGRTVLLVDGETTALIANTQGWEVGSISEPITGGAVRGPRDGFTENLRTNTALVRLRIPEPTIVLWLAGTMVKLALFLHAYAVNLAQTLGFRDYVPLVLPVGALTVVMALALHGPPLVRQRGPWGHAYHPLHGRAGPAPLPGICPR